MTTVIRHATGFVDQMTIDKDISVLLSFAWVVLIVVLIFSVPKIIKLIPKLVEAWHNMTVALDRQNEVTKQNSDFIKESMVVHHKFEEDLIHMQTDRIKASEERQVVTKTIKALTEQVAELKEKIDDSATKEDVRKIEEQVNILTEQIEQLLPFLTRE